MTDDIKSNLVIHYENELQFQGCFSRKQQSGFYKIKLSLMYLTEPEISDFSSLSRKIFWIIQEMEKLDC